MVDVLDGFDEVLLHVFILLMMDEMGCSAVVESMEVPVYQAAGGYGHEARFGSHEFDLFGHIVDKVGDSGYCFCMILDEYDFFVHMGSVSDEVMVVWIDVPVGDITESCHEIYMCL